MNGNIALLGADGMLGRAMHQALRERGADLTVLRRGDLDLARPETIAPALAEGVTWVVNCAAYTDVDGAESNGDLADAVNGYGLGALAERCRTIGAVLVTFGTDYVFDGRATSPYAVGHPVDPQNAYGRSKALGERLLAESGAPYLNVRTSWLYAPWGRNFVLTMARSMRERGSLRVVDDQRGRPTSSRHLAVVTLALAERGAVGTFHATDGGECTWYELARAIADHLGNDCEITPCRSEEFPRPAARPAYSVLGLTKTEAIVGPMPSFHQSVAAALDDAHCREYAS